MIPKVFISYAHDTENFADKVLEFSNKLRENGIDANIDQYEECPPEGWPRWMENQIENSDFVIVISTENYYNRVKNFQSGNGKGVNWEVSIIYQHLYDNCCNNTKFIPVIFDDYKTQNILKPLKSSTFYYVDRVKDFKKLKNRLKGIKNVVKPPLGKVEDVALELKKRKNMFVTSMIDVNLWNKAKWSGAMYIFDKGEEKAPIMGLLYRDKECATKIFEGWRKICNGKIFNDLKISIVEKKNIGKEDGYFIYISSNIDECIKRAEKQGFKTDETMYTVFSRYQYMQIDMFNNNIAIFRKQLENKKYFYIVPAVIESEVDAPDLEDIKLRLDLKIKMNNIKFIKFDDLKEGDEEYPVVQTTEYFL